MYVWLAFLNQMETIFSYYTLGTVTRGLVGSICGIYDDILWVYWHWIWFQGLLCCQYRSDQKFLEFVNTYLSFVTMLIMSVVLIVICSKQHGKERSSHFTHQSLISCCTCAVVFTAFTTPWVIVRFFGLYNLWMIAVFMAMCLRGILCLLWLVICKDIRDSAQCKTTKFWGKGWVIAQMKKEAAQEIW